MSKILKSMLILSFASLCIISTTNSASAQGNTYELTIADIFSDHMVLQRNAPIKLWGTAIPDVAINVELRRGGMTLSNATRSKMDGTWFVTLPPQSVGIPASIDIQSPDSSLTINDIVFGEVWLASGQSNMHLGMSRTLHGKENAATANNPNIRIYDMKIIYPKSKGGIYTKEQIKDINEDKYFQPKGWVEVTPKKIKNFSAVAYYFAEKLQSHLGIPVGIIHNAVPGAPIEAWMSKQSLLKNSELTPLAMTPWQDNEKNGMGKILINIAKNQISKSSSPEQKHPWMPTYLYRNGIKPIENFTIKGVIWYQGESNAELTLKYPLLFKTMLDDWRKKWNLGDFPFYYVQLSSREERAAWPSFRDSQRRILDITTNTGMIVTSDIGDKQDTHAKQKKPVGERLALLALGNAYHQANNYESPLFKNVLFENGYAIVEFKGNSQGLTTSDKKPIRGFEISIGDTFVATEAEIIRNKIRIRLPHTEQKAPIIRYAWKPFSNANLVNSLGLPASTFTSGSMIQFYDK